MSCPDDVTPRDFVSGTTTMKGSIPVKPDHLFQIGSETKSFVAVIILQLESEGLLSILRSNQSMVTGKLPQTWRNIKIKQLLNHSSGIFNFTEIDYFFDNDLNKQWTGKELAKLVYEKEPYFKPG